MGLKVNISSRQSPLVIHTSDQSLKVISLYFYSLKTRLPNFDPKCMNLSRAIIPASYLYSIIKEKMNKVINDSTKLGVIVNPITITKGSLDLLVYLDKDGEHCSLAYFSLTESNRTIYLDYRMFPVHKTLISPLQHKLILYKPIEGINFENIEVLSSTIKSHSINNNLI